MSVDEPQSSQENKPTENKFQDDLLESLLKEDIEIFKILLRKVNPNFKYSSQGDATCLEIACMKPKRGLFVKALLEHVEPTLADVTSQPIHLAARHGHFDSLDALVSDKRTDIAARDSDGNTALILICKFITAQKQDEYLRCFERLVPEMSPNYLNIRDNDGITAFHALVRENRTMRRVWDSGSSIDKSEGGPEELEVKARKGKEARLKLLKRMVQLFRNDLDIETNVEGRLASDDLEDNFPNLKDHLCELRDLDKTHMDLMNCLKSKRVERLRILLNKRKDGYFTYNVNHHFGSPLHTTCLHYACELGLGSKIIEVLLSAGADPNEVIKPTMKSLIHVLCENGHDEELQTMLEGKNPPDINATDRFRNTALHYLLDKPASCKKINLGRRYCLQILLNKEELDIKVNMANISCVTPIMLGIQNRLERLLKDILKNRSNKIDWNLEQDGKSIRAMLREEFPNFVKYIPKEEVGKSEVDGKERKADEQEEIDYLFSLLIKGDEKQFAEEIKKRRILSVCNSGRSHTLLQKAANLGLVDAVTALLDRGADPNYVFPGNKSPPAVIACKYRHYDVLSVFLENRKNGFDVNASDSAGNTALHYAMRTEFAAKNLNIVISLLKCGGSLEEKNRVGKPPMNEKQLECLLDQCLDTNQKNAFDDDYEIIFKYQLIVSSNSSYRDDVDEKPMSQLSSLVEDENKSTLSLNSNIRLNPEMDFLFKMSKIKELSNLLDHPVCLTFLNQKWNRAKYLIYLNIFLYFVFLLLLNGFIVHCAYPMSHSLRRKMKSDHDYLMKKSRVKKHMISMATGIMVFWLFTLIREIIQFSMNMKKYLLSWENYLELSLLISSLATVLIPFVSPDYFYQRIFNVITILLSWSELLVLLGQTSLFAKHIEMLKVVTKNYVLPLMCYCSFVVAFGLSFHTLYIASPKYSLHSLEDEIRNKTVQEIDEENDFNYWHRSIMKALVMMTGELGFDSFPKEEYFSMVLFVVFVLLETIVIINLLAGIASQGTDQIESAAVRLERVTRVQVLTRVEMLLVKLYNISVCGLKLPRWVRRRLRRVVLFAGIARNKREGRVAPNQSSELVFTRDSKLVMTKSALDRATQIISRRYDDAQELGSSWGKSFRQTRMSRIRSSHLSRRWP